MLPSSSEPVLIEGPVSKRGKSVAGIGLWWKTRYLRLTSSFLTVTDLKQQTLLASIPTPEFLICAPVKTRRATGRRFLLRLTDGSVLQLATLTANECVQWVSVINRVIDLCEKQRAKDTLTRQRRKELALQAGSPAFALSSPNLGLHEPFHTAQPPSPAHPLVLHPHPLTPTSLLAAPGSIPARAQSSAVPTPTSGAPSADVATASGLVPLEGGVPPLQRSSSTGAVMERHELERRKSRDRSIEQGRVQAQQAKRGGTSRRAGDSVADEGSRKSRVVNWEEKNAEAARSSSRRRDDDGGVSSHQPRHSHLYEDDDSRYHHRRLSAVSEEDEERSRSRHSSRYDGHAPYPSMPMPPHVYYPYAYTPPPVAGVVAGRAGLGAPPVQRLLFFSLLFLLFSFTILASGHTFRTANQLSSLYHQHVTQANSTLHAYEQPLSQAMHTWPLLGMTVSGLYLAYLLQVGLRDKGVGRGGGDDVDWLGGGMAGLLCTYCLYTVSMRMKAYMQALGMQA